MNKDNKLIFEAYEDTHPGYDDTTWQDEFNGQTVKITMQDVEKMLASQNVPDSGIQIPVTKVAHLDIHTRNKDSK